MRMFGAVCAVEFVSIVLSGLEVIGEIVLQR